MRPYLRILGLALIFLTALAGVLFLLFAGESTPMSNVASVPKPPEVSAATPPQTVGETPEPFRNTPTFVKSDDTEEAEEGVGYDPLLPNSMPLGTGTAAVSGLVVNEAGIALPGMKVYAAVSQFLHTEPCITDKKGGFLFEQLPAGTYEVGVRAADDDSSLRRLHGEDVTLKDREHRTGLRLIYNASEVTITGRVTNLRGEPIESAAVRFNSTYELRGSTVMTDKDGRYRFYPHAYSVTVTVEHPEHSTQQQHVHEGDQGVDFVLEGRGAVEGQVLDAATGAPLTEFEVAYAVGLKDAHDYAPTNFSTIRDGGGHFQLDSVDVGPITVFAQAPGYAPTHKPIDEVRAGQTTNGIMLRLKRASTLRGVVKNARNELIANASVRIDGIEETKTDWSGQFAFTGLHADHTAVKVQHPDYAESTVPLALATGAETPLEIILSDYGAVEGRVYANGEPLARADLYFGAGDSIASSDVVTGDDGYFRLPTVMGGQVNVMVSGPFGRSLSKVVSVLPGHTTTVDFEFELGDGALVGYVVVNGVSLDGGAVIAKSTKAGVETPEQVQCSIAADGTYNISGLLGGNYRVMVGELDVAEPWVEQVQEISIAPGEMVSLDIDLNRAE